MSRKIVETRDVAEMLAYVEHLERVILVVFLLFALAVACLWWFLFGPDHKRRDGDV